MSHEQFPLYFSTFKIVCCPPAFITFYSICPTEANAACIHFYTRSEINIF